MIGVFDLVGTLCSGWLTDRYDPRWLLSWYYGLRGLSLLALPFVIGSQGAGLVAFVVFYGLDWVATVPPTVALTADTFGRAHVGVVFGWIFAAHQLGAGVAALARRRRRNRASATTRRPSSARRCSRSSPRSSRRASPARRGARSRRRRTQRLCYFNTSVVYADADSRLRPHPDEHLSDVRAGEQPDERLRRSIDAVDDRLAVADRPVRDDWPDLGEERLVPLRWSETMNPSIRRRLVTSMKRFRGPGSALVAL